MITFEQYFGLKKYQDGHAVNAHKIIGSVNSLLYVAECHGAYGNWIDPDTGTQISGAKGGSGDGGYRDEDSRTGKPGSTHRFGMGLDVYDPDRKLAQWCQHNQDVMDKFGLWAEDWRWTNGWCHFQTKKAKYGRIFIPSMTAPPGGLAPALDGQKPIPFKIR